VRQSNRVRDHLLGLGLVVAALGGIAVGQPSSPAWAPTSATPPAAGEPSAGGSQPVVIASTSRDKPRALPADARLPLPDDGLPNLMPSPPAPTATAQPAPPPRPFPAEKETSQEGKAIQQTAYQATDQGGVERAGGAPPPPAVPNAARTGAVLGVEVQGPTAGTPQQPFSPTLVVTNHGRDVLASVRVELPVPPSARVLTCEPQAERAGDRLVWLIGNLEGGGERRLRVELLPAQPGELHLIPSASFAAALGLRTSIVRPPFALNVSGPETAAAGDRVIFAIQVGNHTTDPMRLVQIRCQLGAGLWHAQGELIEADLPGGLAAGELKTIHLQAETRGTGRLQVQVTAAADGRHTASSQHYVAVNEPALAVAVEGPRRGMMGHQLAYRIEVSNPGKAAAAGVKLRQSLPQGVEFVTASTQANYDPKSQTITWSLGELAGGQRQSVTFQVKAAQVGDWAMPVTLLADAMTEVRQTHSVHVDAAPALAVEASADDDPLDQGRETTYEVRIFNQAATPAGEVCLSVRLPEQLSLVSAQGPTKERGTGQTILFEPLQQLRGRTSAVYKLRVKGAKVGAGRVSVEVSAAGLATPVQREMTGQVR
jgi:uncharacterized repeat protein (TIGR01451 family)